MVIRVAGVVKRFGAATAVDHADLTVADGELFTLLGPSGCGRRRSCASSRASPRPTRARSASATAW